MMWDFGVPPRNYIPTKEEIEERIKRAHSFKAPQTLSEYMSLGWPLIFLNKKGEAWIYRAIKSVVGEKI